MYVNTDKSQIIHAIEYTQLYNYEFNIPFRIIVLNYTLNCTSFKHCRLTNYITVLFVQDASHLVC